MLKIGLFGVGRIGRMRAQNRRIISRADSYNRVLVGIYDVDTVAAASAATESRVRFRRFGRMRARSSRQTTV